MFIFLIGLWEKGKALKMSERKGLNNQTYIYMDKNIIG